MRYAKSLIRVLGAVCAAAGVLAILPAFAQAAGSLAITTCGAGVFHSSVQSGITATMNCPFNPAGNPPIEGMFLDNAHMNVPAGHLGHWQANAPSGFLITGASVAPNQVNSINLNDGHHWGGSFYWSGGGAKTSDNSFSTGYSVSGLATPFFGFTIWCNLSTGSCGPWNVNPPELFVGQITLSATETSGPALGATGLWAQNGWVRGQWPLAVSGNSPSGLCAIAVSLAGKALQGSSSGRNDSVWHQCAAAAVHDLVTTAAYGQGGVRLALAARDAAGLPASYSKTVYIDNSAPTVSMSGPSDAPSTAGTQVVTATAGGSPSGIDGLACSVDGAAAHWYPGATARVPVAGIAQHTVTCRAANNAVDGAGAHGWSTVASWHLGIRAPTAVTSTFARTTRTHCTRKTIVRGRGKHRHRVRVRRCHAHTIRKAAERVAFRHRATVSGWLGSGSTPLAGQSVTIMAAPLGSSHFHRAVVVMTRANGTWKAKLPAGPSRIVRAVYGGSTAFEPAASAALKLTVPARIRVHVTPNRSPWAGRLVITGRLEGGYIPRDRKQASQLLKLRIGVVGVKGLHGSVGVPNLKPNGRFRTTFCLAPGRGIVRYWFSAVSLFETNYPYARGSHSNRAVVRVGPGEKSRRAC